MLPVLPPDISTGPPAGTLRDSLAVGLDFIQRRQRLIAWSLGHARRPDARSMALRSSVIVGRMETPDKCPKCGAKFTSRHVLGDSGIGGDNGYIIWQPDREHARCVNEHEAIKLNDGNWYLAADPLT